MSNQYPPQGPGDGAGEGAGQTPGQDPYGQSSPPPPPPPGEPQWNPQSGGTPPPPSYGDYQGGTGEQGTGQQGGYGQPPYQPPGAPGGYGQPQQNSPLAIVSLVLGIVGLLCCTVFVISIGAVVTGFLARKQIAESQGRLKGGGMATAGLVLGVVSIVLALVYWVLVISGAISGNYTFETT